MATPHVAGAAAILASPAPGVGRRRAQDAPGVDDRGRSRTLAVYQQGAGRVDVAARSWPTVSVDTAVLSLGVVPQDSAAFTRTLTYDNPTDRPVRLWLSAQVSGTGSDRRERPRSTSASGC